MKDDSRKPKFRIYNLAGNPMMMSLIEGKVDAIVETSGQYCHDVVPGFIIALKAGAYLINLDNGCSIDVDVLGKMLSQPSCKFRYVLACSEELCKELSDLLSPSKRPPRPRMLPGKDSGRLSRKK
jgi:fructose-1,6-bisphosphatase/inositol monophosphatase family enzyme